MVRSLCLALLSLCLLWTGPAAADVREIEFEGLRAYLMQEHSLPIVTIDITFKGAGYAYDPAEKHGLANLAGALLNEGAGKWDRREFKQQLEAYGIQMGIRTGAETASIKIKTLREHMDRALELALLSIREPRFNPTLIDITRKQMKLSLLKEKEDVDEVAARVWMQTAFAGHPYGNHPYGTAQTLDAITQADLSQFTEAYFTRENAAISIVGDITRKEARRLLARIHEVLPQGRASTPVPEPVWTVPPEQQNLFVPKAPAEQNAIYFGLPWVNFSDPDFYPAYILNFVLGGGSFESRLTKEVRETLGLTYSIGTEVNSFDSGAVLMGYASTRKGQENRVIDSIVGIMKEMHILGVSQEELDMAKRYLTGAFALRLGTSDKIASYLTFMQMEGLGPDFIERRNRYIEEVTEADVRRAALRLLQPKQLLFVTAGEKVQ